MKRIFVKIIIVIIFFLTLAKGNAQTDNFVFDKLTIGLTPTALMNPFSGLQFNCDLRLHRKLKTTFEAGYIFNSIHSEKGSGYRIKFGVEFIVYQYNNSAMLLGINKIIRNVKEEQFETIYYPERYSEKKYFERSKVLNGVQVSFGEIYKINDKLRLSFMLGIGAGNLVVSDSEEFNNNNWNSFGFGFNTPGDYFYPVVSFNTKFMYSIFE